MINEQPDPLTFAQNGKKRPKETFAQIFIFHMKMKISKMEQ